MAMPICLSAAETAAASRQAPKFTTSWRCITLRSTGRIRALQLHHFKVATYDADFAANHMAQKRALTRLAAPYQPGTEQHAYDRVPNSITLPPAALLEMPPML